MTDHQFEIADRRIGGPRLQKMLSLVQIDP
jgi:hypothetical protein